MFDLRRFGRRLWRSIHVGSADAQLDREVASHIGLMQDEYQRRGLPPEDAALAARRQFGSTDAAKERHRDERAFRWIGDMRMDVRYAARRLSGGRGFTLTAVTLLALGTGANTAMFSVVDAALLRTVPYERAHELFRLFQQPKGGSRMPVAPANYLDWSARSRSFQSMAAFTGATFRVAIGAGTEQVAGTMVSARLFETLGVPSALGRTFGAEDDQPGGAPIAVLGHALWSTRFGGAKDVIGKPVLLDGEPHTVVGVMPANFTFPNEQTMIWTPLRLGNTARSMSRTENYLGVVGRLQPDVTRDQAQSELATIARQLETAYPDSNRRLGIALRSLREYTVGRVETALLVLMSAVVFVLLIAGVSVSNLLLSSAIVRRREISLRASLGASRGRLVRQLLTESTMLALLGGAAGWLLAQASFNLLRQIIPASVPGVTRMTLDGSVLLFSIAVACVIGLISGLVPALHVTRGQLVESLNDGARASSGRHIFRLRRVLTVVQVAFALVLLVGAGLMLRTMFNLSTVDLGFDPDNVLTATVAMSPPVPREPSSGSDSSAARALQELLDRVEATPGVRAAGAISAVPTNIEDYTSTRLVVEGHATPTDGRVPEVDYSVVTPRYFDAMRIPVLRGRRFTMADGLHAPPVALINATMAARFFAGVDPIGRRIRRGGANSSEPWITIVGVVGDVRHLGPDRQPVPELFLPHAQVPWPRLTAMVRADANPLSFSRLLRDIVHELGPGFEVGTVWPLEHFVTSSVATRRLAAQLLSLFGALATIVAAVGIYTVMTFGVVQRTQEFGVRIALGARKVDLARMVLAQSAAAILVGIVLGLMASGALAGVVGGLLYEVSPRDVISFAGAAVSLLGVGLAASYLPLRRVFRIDPSAVLRNE